MYIGLVIERVVPESAGCVGQKEFLAKTLLQFFDLPLSGILPRGVVLHDCLLSTDISNFWMDLPRVCSLALSIP